VYQLVHRPPGRELIKAVLLAAAFLFWAANQFWPESPQATLYNDIAIALFVFDVFLVMIGWRRLRRTPPLPRPARTYSRRAILTFLFLRVSGTVANSGFGVVLMKAESQSLVRKPPGLRWFSPAIVVITTGLVINGLRSPFCTRFFGKFALQHVAPGLEAGILTFRASLVLGELYPRSMFVHNLCDRRHSGRIQTRKFSRISIHGANL